MIIIIIIIIITIIIIIITKSSNKSYFNDTWRLFKLENRGFDEKNSYCRYL